MIFAAGLGTRLGALTATRPKALVPVAGVPMLERVARRLLEAGVDRLIINTHHHADLIEEFVRERGGFGVEVVFSLERDQPLETGGGLRQAAPLFRADLPFFLHNADVLTDLDLIGMYGSHGRSEPLATLAVMRRETSRYLLFDDEGLLGRVDEQRGIRIEARDSRGSVEPLAFAGVHVVSPAIFPLLPAGGAFSILDAYLDTVRQGRRIEAYRVDDAEWMDIGKPAQLREAEERWVGRSGGR